MASPAFPLLHANVPPRVSTSSSVEEILQGLGLADQITRLKIFPTGVRSHGIGVGFMGWAVVFGAGTLYNEITFSSIGGYSICIKGHLILV